MVHGARREGEQGRGGALEPRALRAREREAAASFGVKDRALEAAVKETEAYVREELGDARSFSLDSPKSRAPKIAALRRMT